LDFLPQAAKEQRAQHAKEKRQCETKRRKLVRVKTNSWMLKKSLTAMRMREEAKWIR
jgi:hypothetical protein